MEEKPLVSIIIPVYMVEAYLHQCIDSVIKQTYKNIEIILIDDGSPDNCGVICDEYAAMDQRIVVIHQENKGLSGARNAGLDVCKGEYIAFLDSDDWYDLKFIEGLLRYADEETLAACGWKQHFSNYIKGIKSRQLQFLDVKTVIDSYLNMGKIFSLVNVVAWNKLYPKSVFQKLRYPLGLVHEDNYLIYEILTKVRRIVIVNEVLYHHRLRPGSIMQNFSHYNLSCIYEACMHQEAIAGNDYKLLNKFKLHSLNHFCAALAKNLDGVVELSKKDIVKYKTDIQDYLSEVPSIPFKLEVKCYTLLYCPFLYKFLRAIYAIIRDNILNKF